MQHYKLRDDFDDDGQLDSTAPKARSARSNPTARRRRNHLEVCKSCMTKVTRMSTLSMGQSIAIKHGPFLAGHLQNDVLDVNGGVVVATQARAAVQTALVPARIPQRSRLNPKATMPEPVKKCGCSRHLRHSRNCLKFHDDFDVDGHLNSFHAFNSRMTQGDEGAQVHTFYRFKTPRLTGCDRIQRPTCEGAIIVDQRCHDKVIRVVVVHKELFIFILNLLNVDWAALQLLLVTVLPAHFQERVNRVTDDSLARTVVVAEVLVVGAGPTDPAGVAVARWSSVAVRTHPTKLTGWSGTEGSHRRPHVRGSVPRRWPHSRVRAGAPAGHESTSLGPRGTPYGPSQGNFSFLIFSGGFRGAVLGFRGAVVQVSPESVSAPPPPTATISSSTSSASWHEHMQFWSSSLHQASPRPLHVFISQLIFATFVSHKGPLNWTRNIHKWQPTSDGVYLNPLRVWTVPSLSAWKFWKIRDDFDPVGQLYSIEPPAPSTPTARRGWNHLEFSKIFMQTGTKLSTLSVGSSIVLEAYSIADDVDQGGPLNGRKADV